MSKTLFRFSSISLGFFKCSITGGYPYKGSQINGMNGVYFFADYCSQEIGMLSYNSDSDLWDMYLDSPNASGSWVTFGEDINGEMYVGSIQGNIYKITDAALGLNSINQNQLEIYPNPTDEILFLKNFNKPIDLIIYDINGRIVIEYNNYSLAQINLSELDKGIYFIQIDHSSIQKIIKK